MKKHLSDFPHLVKEWNYKRNNCSPDQINCFTHKKAWWICVKGHEWQAVVANRSIGNNCPICVNQMVLNGYNDLPTHYPEILKEWNYTKNLKKPEDYVYTSNARVWWICEKKHEWQTSISKRISGTKCPFCQNRKILPGFNDLATTHPGLSKEWHPSKNHLTPEKLTYGSGKKIWWICEKGHEWKSDVQNRTKGKGCSRCKNSSGEKYIDKLLCLQEKKISFIREFKHEKIRNKKKLIFDFAIFENDSLVGFIEFNGKQHYSLVKFSSKNTIEDFISLKKRDQIKIKRCRELKIPLLVVTFSQTESEIKNAIDIFLKEKITNISYHKREINSAKKKNNIHNLIV
jgi:hypothetical protein